MSIMNASLSELSRGIKIKAGGVSAIKVQFATRVRLVGMHFDANKSFLLPQALDGVKSIIEMHNKYPKAQVLIVGHAGEDEDLAGADLAFERAQMMGAFLKNKPNLWLNQFGPDKPARSRWGLRELQLMLSVLPDSGKPFYCGYASGITDAATTQAIQAFQEHSNKEKGTSLPVDGKGEFETRKAIVEAYLGQENTTVADDVTPVAHGVEGHFTDTKSESGVEVDDRRLDVFFFLSTISPLPETTSSQGDASPYPKWLENLMVTDDFEAHGIHVQIVDSQKQPAPFAEVQLTGPTSGKATTDEHGFVSFTDLKAGEYTIRSEKNGYKIGASRLVYPTGKTTPGFVKSASGA